MKDLASDRLTRVCGTLSPFTWTSDTNEVLITFTSNEYSTNLGYQASYSTMPRFERNGKLRTHKIDNFISNKARCSLNVIGAVTALRP